MEAINGRTYTDVERSRHGLMICGACNKPITKGEYRVREKAGGSITHHRACTADDPAWKTVDRREAEREAAYQALRVACAEFHAKWGITDLSDYLDETESL